MEHRIIDMPTFFFIGKLVRTKKSENPSSALGELAKKMTPEVEAELKKLCDLQVKDIVHVTYSTGEDFDDPNGEIVHLIGVISSKEIPHDKYAVIEMPACSWAIFPSEGKFPESLHETLNGIYLEWLPHSDYSLAAHISFSYTRVNPQNYQNAYTEIWVPVMPYFEA